jgi:hypothetical protein
VQGGQLQQDTIQLGMTAIAGTIRTSWMSTAAGSSESVGNSDSKKAKEMQ